MIGVLLYDDVINRFVVDPLTMATDATTGELHCGNCLSPRFQGNKLGGIGFAGRFRGSPFSSPQNSPKSPQLCAFTPGITVS